MLVLCSSISAIEQPSGRIVCFARSTNVRPFAYLAMQLQLNVDIHVAQISFPSIDCGYLGDSHGFGFSRVHQERRAQRIVM